MQPVTVSIDVSQTREDVYAFLDVMANHEPFTNHMLTDWTYAGPARGVGAQARAKARAAGRVDDVAFEMIEARAPATIVERNVGAGGRRVATGTYRLEPLPGGGTRIAFEYAWQAAPRSERLAAPLVRSVMRRANRTSLERLARLLAERG